MEPGANVWRTPRPRAYAEAFATIARQGGNQILVAVAADPMARHRDQGIGEALFHAAIDLAREAGCGLIQLATDRSQPDAPRSNQRLGFVASHEGMKLPLEP